VSNNTSARERTDGTGRAQTELSLVEVEVLDGAQRMLVTLRAAAEVLVPIVERVVLLHERPKVLLFGFYKYMVIMI
jgi:hypothetical protein